jgi:hypothetical protein
VAATPKSQVDKCDYTFVIRKSLPKAYIEQYIVAQFEGWILIENTSFETSSPFSMAFETIVGNHTSNGGNFVKAFG